MVSYLEVEFKIVWTAIARTYRFRKNTTVSEFIDEIKNHILRDDVIRGLGIENFELVPLYNSSPNYSAEEAPALPITDTPLHIIYNSHRFFYIRPIVNQAIVEQISSVAEQPDQFCIICTTNNREIAFAPCGHFCICRVCNSNPLVTRCPICRHPDSVSLEIFHP